MTTYSTIDVETCSGCPLNVWSQQYHHGQCIHPAQTEDARIDELVMRMPWCKLAQPVTIRLVTRPEFCEDAGSSAAIDDDEPRGRIDFYKIPTT